MELAITKGMEHQVKDLAVREELMNNRRKDQQRHHSKQIWTKEPHGGPYVKRSPTTSEGVLKHHFFAQCHLKSVYDALIDFPNGNKRAVALGYERPQRGSTTNFVGNHMTQGAIDLVQMELKRPGPLKKVRDLGWYERDANALFQMPATRTTKDMNSHRVREDSRSSCACDLAALRRVLRLQRASSAAAAAGALSCAPLADSSPEAQLAPAGTSEPQNWGITEDTRAELHVPAHAASSQSTAKQVQSLTAQGDDAVRLGDHNRALQVYTAALVACGGATDSLHSTEPALKCNLQPSSSQSTSHNADEQQGVAANSGIDCQVADYKRGESATSKRVQYTTGHAKVEDVVEHINENFTFSAMPSHVRRAPAQGVVKGLLHLKCAECHVHMGAHGTATTQCTTALNLLREENFNQRSDLSAPHLVAVTVAALLRRGLASEVLEKYVHSKRDFLAALSLDPSNKMASTALARLARVLSAHDRWG